MQAAGPYVWGRSRVSFLFASLTRRALRLGRATRAGRDVFAPLLAPLVFRALLRKSFALRGNGRIGRKLGLECGFRVV